MKIAVQGLLCGPTADAFYTDYNWLMPGRPVVSRVMSGKGNKDA